MFERFFKNNYKNDDENFYNIGFYESLVFKLVFNNNALNNFGN